MAQSISGSRLLKYALVIAMAVFAGNSRAAVETPDSEAIRNRAKQEAQERERQQKLPSVDLHGALPEAAPFQLPVAEKPCFTIHNFVLEVPGELSPAAQRYGASKSLFDPFHFVQNFLEQYTGLCVGREGINLIVKGATAKILERGYSTTRVSIPQQDLSGGTLKLSLLPGLINEIKFIDEDVRGTWKNAFPTSAGQLLNLRDLEQGMEQMKRVLNQDVEIIIVPAKNPGESDIAFQVKRGKPWRTTTTLDDSGAKGTGKIQAGVQLGWDNLLGINDIFSLGINTDAGRNGNISGTRGDNFSYSIPYGYWTSTVSANESKYHQLVIGAVQNFVSSGKSQNLEAKINYLFHRDQFSKSSVQLRAGKRWSHSFVDDTEIAVQKRNTTLAEIALIHKHNIGQAQLDTTLAYRRGAPWFGAQTDPADLPSSSARYRYGLETLDATLSVPFKIEDRPLNYTATLRAQNTNTALYASEWFAIGNRWTVRGFDGESSLGAEKGYFLRNQIDVPISGTLQSAYVGMDFGKVFGQNAANLSGNKLAGMVLGLKGTVIKCLTYDVFAGWALYKPQGMPGKEPTAGFSLMCQL